MSACRRMVAIVRVCINKHKYFVFILISIVLIWSLWLVISREKVSNAQPYISTLIVPHHDLVAKQRSVVFDSIKDRAKGRRIILLSPNHYDMGDSILQTRPDNFTTKFGIIPIDEQLYELVKQLGATDNEATFDSEHGVKTILPDIARTFPGQAILPVIVKSEDYQDKLELLLSKLHTACQDCLLIASADFSHYQPYQLSELHDRTTLRMLEERDEASVKDQRAEVGEPQILFGALRWAGLSGTDSFVLQNHTNSTELTNDYFAEGTTHMFGWYETGKKKTHETFKSFTIASSHNLVNEQYFSELGNRVLWGTDAVHLGGWQNESISSAKYLHLSNDNPAINIMTKSEKDLVVPQDDSIIYLQGTHLNREEWQKLAEQWIDAGADIVVRLSDSYEPPQPLIAYKNRVIAYSLGWFADKDIGDSEAILLHGEFYEDRITIVPSYIVSKGSKPILQRTSQANDVLKSLFQDFENELVSEKGGLLFSLSTK